VHFDAPRFSPRSKPMIGQTIGHYRIDGKLGEGGMGTVFKAEDLRLRRPVALKLIHPDERGASILREARAASRLTHPNVATVYEVGQQSGIEFIVMELVEGVSVAKRLEQGPLPLAEALSVAQQVAAALAAAETKGMVHRDIKPGNIMVTGEGQVKLLDFGLAEVQATEHERTDTIPHVGTSEGIRGTLSYMSPEQLDGKPATIQSDIFALGAVLHEMVTGKNPFLKETTSATIASIVSRDEVDVAASDVPASVKNIIQWSLRKNPLERPASARLLQEALEEAIQGREVAVAFPRKRFSREALTAIAAALIFVIAAAFLAWRNWRPPAATPSASKTILVLPLKDSTVPDSEYAWTVSQALSERAEAYQSARPISVRQIHDVLRILQRDTSGPLDEETARAVSRRIKPNFLLLTRLKQLGQSFDIQCSFNDPLQWNVLFAKVVNGRVLTSELWSKLDDLAQTFFSQQFALRLEQKQPTALGTKSPAAYRSFLLAEQAEADSSFSEAIGHLQQAVAEDPAFSMAWGRLALTRYSASRPPDEIEQARTRALREAPSAPEKERFLVRTISGVLQHDKAGSIAAVDAIMKNYSGDERALALAGEISMTYSLWDRAVSAGRLLQVLNPYSYYASDILMQALIQQHRWKEVEVALQKMRQIEPYRGVTFVRLGEYHLTRGDYSKALQDFTAAEQFDEGIARLEIGLVYEALGQLKTAQEVYEKLSSLKAAPRFWSLASTGLARVAVAQDDLERAWQLLERIPDQEKSPETFNVLADVFLRQKKHPQLEALNRNVSARFASSPYTYRIQAQLMFAQGKGGEALPLFAKAAESARIGNAPYFDTEWGNALLAQGRTSEAVAAYGKALEICPNWPDAHLGLSLALRRTTPESAARHLKQFEDLWADADPGTVEREKRRLRSAVSSP
jgi:serine/threonine protein kinase/predicted negative regulator of RcsB-dependent stress response